MSTQMLMSDLLTDLSTDEQQLLAGGQVLGREDETDDESEFDDEGEMRRGRAKTFIIRSRAIVRVRKLR
ncbi:MAG: hypothetical protein KME23_17310 [Goleter apudmare HA4340-LM2]|jgi:hypothetical protein|nr:hypothetical protein [Goleter apudmare HA4340-LM2]